MRLAATASATHASSYTFFGIGADVNIARTTLVHPDFFYS